MLDQSVVDSELMKEQDKDLMADPFILRNACLGETISNNQVRLNACKDYIMTFMKFMGDTYEPDFEDEETMICYPFKGMDALILHGVKHGYIIPEKFTEALERSGM